MNERTPLRLWHARGFTLVESIAVMVIMGIVATMLVVFIQLPVRSYANTVAMAAASDLADNAMRRMTRELRLALPNSVRRSGSGNYIEFIETKAGLRYLGDDDINTPGGTALSWDNAAALSFTVVGGLPTGRQAPVAGDSVVVYNLGDSQPPGDAYNCAPRCNRAQVGSVVAAASQINLTTNPFAAQTAAGEALMSPSKRFHLVTTPVTYGCNPTTGRLTRYWNYGWNASQVAPPVGGNSAILAENLVSCDFSYTSMASQRSGLVGISLTFRVQNESKSAITLQHQVHVDNTP